MRPRQTPALLAFALLALAACDDPPTAPEAPEAPPDESAAETEAPPAPTPITPREERAPAIERGALRRTRDLLREARAANRSGDSETAIARYRTAAELDSDGRVLCELGWVQLQAGQLAAARDSLTRALGRLPTEDPVPAALIRPVGSCLYNMGRLEEQEGNVAEARRRYARSLAVRPGNRVVRGRLDALPSDDAEATLGAELACSNGGNAVIDLDAWTTRIRALHRLDRLDEPLGALGLSPLRATDFFDPMDGEVTGLSVDVEVTAHELSLGDARGHAVHAVITDEGGNRADRVAVLRTNEDGTRCLLGSIEAMVDACSTSCLSEGPVFALSIVQLAAQDRDALRVDTETGACTCGSYRGAHIETAFHGVEGDRLARYLTEITYDAWYTSPWPPSSETSAQIELTEGFPRRIRVARQQSCGECASEEYATRAQAVEDAEGDEAAALEEALFDDCGPEPSRCEPSTETAVYVYRDGGYAEAG